MAVSSTSMSNAKKIVEKARHGFETDLFAEDYAQIHSDEGHLAALLNLCQIRHGKRYLDLGTGNGYIGITSRTSTLPSNSKVGHPLAISTAASSDGASTKT